MYTKSEAHELIQLLKIHEAADSRLINNVEPYRIREDWEGVISYWRSVHSRESRPLEESNYIEGLAEMYLGIAHELCDVHDLQQAFWHYRAAQQMFSYDNDCHCEALALMAQAGILRVQGELDEASRLLHKCQDKFAGLLNRYAAMGDQLRSSRYGTLCSRVQDLIDVLSGNTSNTAYLILHAGETAAGDPVYIANDTLTDVVSLNGETCTILSLPDRAPMEFAFKSTDIYFTLDVRGDSMIGAGIEPNDRVLVKLFEDLTSLSSKDPAVILIDDPRVPPTSLIKFVRFDADSIYLESANATYAPRKFSRDKNVLRVQGIVVAVLKEVEH